jgi:Adenylosuccinate lyase (EC 4.3.2.2)
VRVEVEYFIALCELPLPQLKNINKEVFPKLQSIVDNFSEEDASRVKETEKVTNHDVKAVEYFIKEKFDELGLEQYKEFIHFGLTSQDINNTSVPLSLKDALTDVYYPLLDELIVKLTSQAEAWADVAMLAKTHGQPASPTRLGKEIMVFASRLQAQLQLLRSVPLSAKFGGSYRKL